MVLPVQRIETYLHRPAWRAPECRQLFLVALSIHIHPLTHLHTHYSVLFFFLSRILTSSLTLKHTFSYLPILAVAVGVAGLVPLSIFILGHIHPTPTNQTNQSSNATPSVTVATADSIVPSCIIAIPLSLPRGLFVPWGFARSGLLRPRVRPASTTRPAL